MATNTRSDGIYQSLTPVPGQTIDDLERQRLLTATGASPVGNTLQDLYRLAGEKPRLW